MTLGEQRDQRGVHGLGLTDEDSLDVARDALRNGMHIDLPQGTCI
jgi:hypothetical protein